MGEDLDYDYEEYLFRAVIDIADDHKHAILRLYLGRKVEDVSELSRAQAQDGRQGHAMHVATGRRFRCVDVGMRVDPDQPYLLVLTPLLAVEFPDSRHSACCDGGIASPNQPRFASFQG